ncbi:MAG TPA: AAA family ATPase, partial [Burkholderiaceae bacterium]
MTSDLDSQLKSLEVLRETARLRVSKGLWGAASVACVVRAALDPSGAETARVDLRAEARILALLQGVAGVPRVIHFDLPAATLVTSLASGRPLSTVPPAWLGVPRHALQLGLAVAAILRDVHAARVFHGELHPGKVILDVASGEVTLIDFSDAVAQSHVDPDFVHPSTLGRMLPFSAPEQTGRMGRAVDYRADLYALGALLYWAVTGQAPFIVADDPLALLHALLTRQPSPPESLNPEVSPALSSVILKLLAKSPNERYQSAHGVLADLQRCLELLAGALPGTGFVPGLADRRIKPARPSHLIGREAELARLTAALDARDERCRVVLVHGYSGAGKTALVRGMYPHLSARNGIVVGGRYDEYQRLTPFSGLTDALSDLAEYWLSSAPETLEALRVRLLAALGANAGALLRLAPAFGQLLWPHGPPPRDAAEPVDNLSLRMQAALAALFRVIRDGATPLLLFIDNLQWADAGSLELFEAVALNESRAPILLVGTYRSNEVDAAHPLAPVLARIRASRTEVVEIAAANLGPAAVTALVVDVLVGTPVQAVEGAPGGASAARTAHPLAPLAQVLHRRTEGNPLFVLRYLRRLFDARELRPEAGGWCWNDEALEALP